MIACENSGHEITYDFAEASKIVEAGATSKSIKDYELTRYARYLIVQNGDPRKEVIALGGSIINNVGENSSVLFLYGDVKNKYICQIPIIVFVLEFYVCTIKKYMVLVLRHKPYIFNFYLL